MRPFLLKVTSVGAILVLLWVMCQFVDHAPWMGYIENDQAFCLRRKVHGELPGDGPTPVVTDDDGFVSSKMTNDGMDISYQVAHRVLLTSLRFIAQIVTT